LRRGSAVALAGAFGALVLAALAAGAESTPPTARDLVVERAGTVRVALPAALYPPDSGFAVVGPDGARVPSHLIVLDAGGGTRPVRVASVAESTDGWLVTLDAGSAPPLHQGLRLPLAVAGLVVVELESSADAREWQPLTTASLFRLGAGDELRGSALAYPATDARYLRLHWPTASRFPRLEGAQIDRVATAAEEVLLPGKACAAAGLRRAVCDLAGLGDRPVESLAVTLPAGRGAGWRLSVASRGRWESLGEGVWGPLPQVVARRVPAGGRGGPLRLEIYGEGDAPLPLRLAPLLLPLALEIQAPTAGSYVLQSAAGLARTGTLRADDEGGGQWLIPGPPRTLPPPTPLPVPDGAALPKMSFSRHWPVRVEATPGTAVRLPLPAAVEAAARADLGDLRLARQGRQVPYLVEEMALPERIGNWDVVSLRPRGEGISVGELPLAVSPREPLGELLLRVPARPLDRTVRVLRSGVSAGVGQVPDVATGWYPWRCEPMPPLPCELALEPPPSGRGPLRLEIADGDNAPLAELSAELWRPRRELLFPWPGEPVALLAGSPRLPSPQYDLRAVAGELRARAPHVARLGRAVEGSAETPARWPRWAVLASLGLAAGVLLLLLARALPRMPESGAS